MKRSACIASLSLAIAPLALVACMGRARTPTHAGLEQVFPTPTDAVNALVGACRDHDEAALVRIFGDEARRLISSGDPETNRQRCDRFVAAAGQMTRLDPKGPDSMELVVGTDDWPFPIPLVKDAEGWHFDTARGAREILSRRIGTDELEAISFCRAYVHAQEQYARLRPEGDGSRYAQKLASTPGRRDGLYWLSPREEENRSPLGPAVAAAGDYSRSSTPPSSWWGYYFRVLTAQGTNAPGGRYTYLRDGSMVDGFALIAYPARYGSTGIMTFLVARDGRVYEKDLGPDTQKIATATKEYDPDSTWKQVAE